MVPHLDCPLSVIIGWNCPVLKRLLAMLREKQGLGVVWEDLRWPNFTSGIRYIGTFSSITWDTTLLHALAET